MELKIILKESDLNRFIACVDKIEKNIMEDNPIRASLVKEFFDYLSHETDERTAEQIAEAKALSASAIKKLKALHHYTFTTKVSIIPPFCLDNKGIVIDMPNFVEYDLEKLLSEVLLSFLIQLKNEKYVTKDLTISFFYKELNKQISQFEDFVQKKIKDYKRKVMAGVLTQTVSFSLSHKKFITNHEVFKSVDYTISQTKKRLVKKID